MFLQEGNIDNLYFWSCLVLQLSFKLNFHVLLWYHRIQAVLVYSRMTGWIRVTLTHGLSPAVSPLPPPYLYSHLVQVALHHFTRVNEVMMIMILSLASLVPDLCSFSLEAPGPD